MEKVVIFPRSPREIMDGWVYLPRFIDKVRLHLAGKLAPDYQENFTNGFDARWLKAAGLTADQFINVVKNSITDGEVCDWVRKNVNKTQEEKETFNRFILNCGKPDDPNIHARFQARKQQAGIAHRADIQTFVDLIELDEKRL
jgi:gluconokinase